MFQHRLYSLRSDKSRGDTEDCGVRAGISASPATLLPKRSWGDSRVLACLLYGVYELLCLAPRVWAHHQRTLLRTSQSIRPHADVMSICNPGPRSEVPRPLRYLSACASVSLWLKGGQGQNLTRSQAAVTARGLTILCHGARMLKCTEILTRGWRAGSVGENTHCSCTHWAPQDYLHLQH